MKKVFFMMSIFAAILLASCSVNQQSEEVSSIEYNLTGNSAIDSSLPFLSREELEMFQLIRKSDVSSTSEKTASVEGNVGPNKDMLSVNVYGPLHDQRLVKGKKIAVSLYKGNGGLTGTWTVYYGYASQGLTHTVTLSQSTYGNYVAFIDLDYASMFYFKVVGGDGTVIDYNGQPFSARMYDQILSYTLQDGRLTINYSGPASGNDTSFHVGWNNWSETRDYSTYYDNWPIAKYAQPGGYNYTTIDVPWWANYIDFAIHGNGMWDNNKGLDFHTCIRPLVSAQVSSFWNNQKQVNIYYAGGRLH